jgi:hypothetical protein
MIELSQLIFTYSSFFPTYVICTSQEYSMPEYAGKKFSNQQLRMRVYTKIVMIMDLE